MFGTVLSMFGASVTCSCHFMNHQTNHTHLASPTITIFQSQLKLCCAPYMEVTLAFLPVFVPSVAIETDLYRFVYLSSTASRKDEVASIRAKFPQKVPVNIPTKTSLGITMMCNLTQSACGVSWASVEEILWLFCIAVLLPKIVVVSKGVDVWLSDGHV